ncbi:MAG: peptidylprolyl isomerase [Clostridiales bacterium]|jgi:parvulin-like peptidyl-prolyl isomerase|nr:peptidylprolyl isomerase [Clostridiales bacterium]
MKKLTILLLIVAMCVSITGCSFGKMDENTVAKIDGIKLTKDMYAYYLSTAKNSLSAQNTANITDFWAQGTIDGENAGVAAKKAALDMAAKEYAQLKKADKLGIKISVEEEKSIQSDKESIKAQFGGEEQYQSVLTAYSLTDESYTQVLRNSRIQQKLMEKLKSDTTEDDFKDYYLSQMYRIKHILINTVNNDTNEKLSADEIAAAKTQIDELLARARAGEDFDALVDQYSQDPGSKSQPDGYVMGHHSNMVKPFLDTANSLEVGQISDVVETSYGYHVLKKYAVDPNTYSANAETVKNEWYYDEMAKLQENANVRINQQVYDAITL